MSVALIGAGLGLASLINQNEQGRQQRDQLAQAQALINAVPLPVLKEYYPELYQQVAQILPEAEQAVEMGPSAMESVATDPALRAAQMRALGKLQEVGDSGMTASDRARLAQIQGDVQAQLKGETGAIQQNLAARGMAGGMSEMVARQIAAQGGANRQAQMGLDLKAQAEQRALEAIMKSGELGGQMQGQEFNQQAQVAQAKDAINRFNTQNLQTVGSTNVRARNEAQQMNAQQAQNTANLNTQNRNAAQQYNLGLSQQDFQNRMARATGQASAATQQAALMGQQAATQNQMIGSLIQAGAQYYGGQRKNDDLKKPGV